jgi:hypothetical protein
MGLVQKVAGKERLLGSNKGNERGRKELFDRGAKRVIEKFEEGG